MTARFEHANITVPDVDAAIAFLGCIEPRFRILHDDRSEQGYRWVHFGTPQGYFALEDPHVDTPDAALKRRYRDFGVNHIGLVVEDVDATSNRLKAAGYAETHVEERNDHRIRRYFLDSAGMEWELVQYLTDDPSKQFAYDT